MKVDILPFSTFKEISSTKIADTLIGTQCIYPLNLQTPILKTFIKSENSSKELIINLNSNQNSNSDNDFDYNNLAYCFEINKICLYPKYTYSDNNITVPMIIISDYFYNKYFANKCSDLVLNIIYNIPIVKMIRLKRIDGNFPSDDSIEYLLTNYFESCSIVNLNQEFEFDLYDDSKIKFEVNEIIYKTEFIKNINQRIEEINYMIQFNTLVADEYPNFKIPAGISECESIVTDYQWHFHTLGKKIANLGYLVDAEVEIDFVISEQEIPKYQAPDSTFDQSKPFKQVIPSELNNVQLASSPVTVSEVESVFNSNTGRSLIEDEKDYQPEVLTPEEIRRRRLAFFNK